MHKIITSINWVVNREHLCDYQIFAHCTQIKRRYANVHQNNMCVYVHHKGSISCSANILLLLSINGKMKEIEAINNY